LGGAPAFWPLAKRTAEWLTVLLLLSFSLTHSAVSYCIFRLGSKRRRGPPSQKKKKKKAAVACASNVQGADANARDEIRRRKKRPRKSQQQQKNRCVLSIIIPAYNEGSTIALTLASIARGHAEGRSVEVVIVDGGCTDGGLTRQAVDRISRSPQFEQIPLRVITSQGGRGPALAAGCAESTGRIVCLLHADSILPPDYYKLILVTLDQPGVALCAFEFQLDRDRLTQHSAAPRLATRRGAVREKARRPSWVLAHTGKPRLVGLSLMEFSVHVRSAVFEMPYGDQAFCVKRAVLEQAGGVPCQPMMEDYEMSLRLRRLGKIVIMPAACRTSPRRFEAMGLWLACLVNQLVVVAYNMGLSAERAFAFYYWAAR
jgi:cellulose synthase/poly-beta-1,6-N-acetylglucosamine synthase-like glycosyltransferase